MMPATIAMNGTADLAPSELVLLNGERFAKRSRIGNVKLPQNGAKVSAGDLGIIMLAAAVLASEQSCVIRLDVRQKKVLFGLRKVDALYAEPLDGNVSWPPHSVESQIYTLAVQLRAEGDRHEVKNVMYAWLGRDCNAPWQLAVDLVQSGMADRGALARIQERKMRVLKTIAYKMTTSTAKTASEQPIIPVFSLLEECQQSRPYVWQLLLKQIKSAIDSRTDYGSEFDVV